MPYGITIFVECKKEGEALRPGQQQEIFKLHRLGHLASVVDSYESVEQWAATVKEILAEAKERSELEARRANEQLSK
jgi:hypothetical protein